MTGKVEGWTHYNEWGEITHNAVLKCGQRELDMVKRYATHDYDSVLSMYYAKARFYDAQNRRFASTDPILDGSVYDITDYAKDPVQLIQYLYVKNNPVIYIDPDGLRYVIDDLDPYGTYSKIQEKKETEKLFENQYYRQEHKDMFIEGIASTSTTPIYGLDLSQARDYNKKIQKCDNNNISDEVMGKNATFIQNLLDEGDKLVNDWLESQFGSSFGTDEIGAFFLMMDKDQNGVYHANFNAWQQIGGYNDLYDYIFDIGTNMNKEKFPFSHNGNEYVMWAWKGDYVNLGAGAELGIYSNQSGFSGLFNVSSPNDEHWLVDTSLAMPMTLKLEDNSGNLISDYSANHWWITSFNPEYKDVDANNLSATYTVDFSNNQDMFNSFSNAWYGQDKRLIIANDNYTVRFEFK